MLPQPAGVFNCKEDHKVNRNKSEFASKMPDKYARMKMIMSKLGVDPGVLEMTDNNGTTIRDEFGANNGEFALYVTHPIVQAGIILDHAVSGRYTMQANGSSEARTQELIENARLG